MEFFLLNPKLKKKILEENVFKYGTHSSADLQTVKQKGLKLFLRSLTIVID